MMKSKAISLLFLGLFISMLVFPIVSVSAASSQNTVRWDWLTVNIFDDPNDNLHHVVGSFSLFGLESLGISEQNENGVIFESRATFGVEIISFLGLDLYDCYPDMNLDKVVIYPFAAYVAVDGWYPSPYILSGSGVVSAYINTIDLGTLNHQRTKTLVPITFGINPTFSNLGGSYINNILIENVVYAHEVKSATVSNQRYGFVGDYMDIYTEQTRSSGGLVTETIRDDSPSQQKISDGIKKLDLGWDYIRTVENLSIQQSIHYAPPSGHIYTNMGTGNLNINYDLTLQPAITKTIDEINLRTAGIVIATNPWESLLHVITPVQEHVIERIKSIHVHKPMIKETFVLEVYFKASVELDVELYKSAMNDPNFCMGDWLWNGEPGSGSGTIPTKPAFFEEYGWILVLILMGLGLIVGLYFYVKIKGTKVIVKQVLH